MSSGSSDVVVHVGRPIGATERAALARALGAAARLRNAGAHPGAAQLVVVDFDPAAISALGVLRCFKALGHNARLVGM